MSLNLDQILVQLAESAGDLWFVAVAVAFAAMVCESARPHGEMQRVGVLRSVSLIASFLVPLLLFVDVFWSVAAMDGVDDDERMAALLRAARSIVLIGVGVVMLVLLLMPSVVAAILQRLSPAAAGALYAIAPFVTLASLAFVIYVTHANVLAAIDLLTSRLAAA